MSDESKTFDDEPMMQKEPGAGDMPENIWMRGLYMILLAVLFGFAEAILGLMALVQFGWMLFAKEKNTFIADVGTDLGRWMAAVVDFQTGRTEDKPFPWDSWSR